MTVTFKAIVGGVLFLSFMVFVAFFGRLPALRRTPVGALHRLMWIHTPNALLAADRRLTAGRVSRSLKRFANHMVHDRHPTVVIFFVLVMAVAELFFVPEAWPQLGWLTRLTATITIVIPYALLYLACAADPGYITPETHAYYMSLYPYDYAIFHPGNKCRTCHLLKPARSKHCSICKRCVAKSDHHCIFINSCVGYGNQHLFLLLLLVTGVLTAYGSVLGLSLLGAQVKQRLPTWSFWPPKDMSYKRYLEIWAWAIQRNAKVGSVMLLASLLSPLVWGLALYSFYLVYCGMTTNESMKWSDWKYDMKDGFAFQRYLPPVTAQDPRRQTLCSRWPKEPDQILLATSDGQAPKGAYSLPGEGEWERVWKLEHVDNLYDIGLSNNFKDVFVTYANFAQQTRGTPRARRFRARHSRISSEDTSEP